MRRFAHFLTSVNAFLKLRYDKLPRQMQSDLSPEAKDPCRLSREYRLHDCEGILLYGRWRDLIEVMASGDDHTALAVVDIERETKKLLDRKILLY